MKVGQWVSYVFAGKQLVGQVYKVVGNAVSVTKGATYAETCEGSTLKGARVSISSLTLVSPPKGYVQIKTGMWLKYIPDGRTGIAHKTSGTKVSMLYDTKGGNIHEHSHLMFEIIDAPTLDDCSIMDEYAIKGIREAGGDETRRFEATIYKNDKRFAIVSNDGIGGDNNYRPLMGKYDVLEDMFEKSVEWCNHHSKEKLPYKGLCMDTWVDYVAFVKKLGIPAKEHMNYESV